MNIIELFRNLKRTRPILFWMIILLFVILIMIGAILTLCFIILVIVLLAKKLKKKEQNITEEKQNDDIDKEEKDQKVKPTYDINYKTHVITGKIGDMIISVRKFDKGNKNDPNTISQNDIIHYMTNYQFNKNDLISEENEIKEYNKFIKFTSWLSTRGKNNPDIYLTNKPKEKFDLKPHPDLNFNYL